MPLNPQERLLPALRSYTLSSYAILLRYAISDKPNQPANSVRRLALILMLSRKNTFFYMLMIAYLYAILRRYAILRKPELSNNSVRRLTSANRSHIAYFLCCTYYFLPPASSICFKRFLIVRSVTPKYSARRLLLHPYLYLNVFNRSMFISFIAGLISPLRIFS